MGKKLYVGNLAYTVTSEALEQMFLEFGTVIGAQVIQDRDTGRNCPETERPDESRVHVAYWPFTFQQNTL